jgi:hypothetical protein
MVFRVQQLSPVTVQTGANGAFDVETVLHPEWPGAAEGGEPAGRDGEIRLEKSLELQQRLFVKNDRIELRRLNAGFCQTVTSRLAREAFVAFDAGKAFLLRRRDDAVPRKQASGAVVIERGYAEDVLASQLNALSPIGGFLFASTVAYY